MSIAKIDSSAARQSIKRMMAGIEDAAHTSLVEAKNEMVRSAKGTKFFKDRTGRTRDSIHGQINGLSGFVECGGASGWLEFGTRPHYILPNGKALRFVMNGQVMIRSYVFHPGTHPLRFIEMARNSAERTLNYLIEYRVGRVITRG